MATEIDLTAAGSTTTINGAVFVDSANIGSGTGNYNTFLAIQDNDGNELGFNADGAPTTSNPDISDSKTHTVLLASVPVTIVNDVAYYEFRVDLNENNSNPNGQISLDAFKIYTSSSGTITSKSVLDATGTVAYDMDAGGDKTLLLSEVSTGSGTDDYAVFVPVSNFAGSDPATTYLYLYTEMGFKGGDYQAQAGFEEWNTQTAGTLTGLKFLDSNDNGVKDPGETGIAGITVFIDTDKDGVLDAGERSTVTDANGNYSFYGVPLGTYQIDEVVPAGDHQTTGASETATISSLGQVVTVDPIGNAPNFVPHYVLSIQKDGTVPDGTADTAGEVISWTIDVSNAGNAAVSNVSVTDALAPNAAPVLVGSFNSGDTDQDGQLDVGETWHYTATTTITQADLDSKGGGDGDIDNTATAHGTGAGDVSDGASVPLVYDPNWIVEKTASVTDADGDAQSAIERAGDVVHYTVTVENDGNVTLTNVQLSDLLEGAGQPVGSYDGDNNANNKLDPGETWTWSYTHEVTQGDIDANGYGTPTNGTPGDGSLDNIATATSTEIPTGPDDASVPIDYNPDWIVEKSAEVTSYSENDPAGLPNDGNIHGAGDVVTYTVTIINDGNVTLTDVQLSDLLEGVTQPVGSYDGDTNNNGTLDPGETWTWSYTHEVTQDEINGNGGGDGSLDNVATATSTEIPFGPAEASVPIDQAPSLTIAKDADVSSVDAAGDVINYTITVDNTGNVDLTGVTLGDAFAGATLASGDDGDGVLETNETWVYTASHMVTQAEMNAGADLVNVAVVDTDQTDEQQDDATTQVQQNPGIQILKLVSVDGINFYGDVASLPIVLPNGQVYHQGTPTTLSGATVSYEVVVTNTGNTTDNSITVTDVSNTNLNFTVGGSLAPGASEISNILTTTAGTTLGAHNNIAEVDGTVGTTTGSVSDTDIASYTVVGTALHGLTKGFWANHQYVWDNTTTDDWWSGIAAPKNNPYGNEGQLYYGPNDPRNVVSGANDLNPVTKLVLGDVNHDGLSNDAGGDLNFNFTAAQALLNSNTSGDVRVSLASQALASQLNDYNDGGHEPNGLIEAAVKWLTTSYTAGQLTGGNVDTNHNGTLDTSEYSVAKNGSVSFTAPAASSAAWAAPSLVLAAGDANNYDHVDIYATGNGLANALQAYNNDGNGLVISSDGQWIGWGAGGTIIDVHHNDPGVFWAILHDQHVAGIS